MLFKITKKFFLKMSQVQKKLKKEFWFCYVRIKSEFMDSRMVTKFVLIAQFQILGLSWCKNKQCVCTVCV